MPAFLFLFFSSQAHATELWVSPAELCAMTDHVVLAEATSAETFWGTDNLLYTRTWFSTLWTFQGLTMKSFDLVLPGGTDKDLTLAVGGTPDFRIDHRYVIPLTDNADGSWHLTSEAAVAAADHISLAPADLDALGVCHGH